MSERSVIATLNVEKGEDDKFYYVLDDKRPVGPYDDEDQATQAALNFLQAAMERLVTKALTGE